MNPPRGEAAVHHAAGIDVGGTMIKIGIVTTKGDVVEPRNIAYASMSSFEEIADTLAAALAAAQAASGLRIRSIGLAAPGHARPSDGLMVDGTANVPLLRNRSLALALRQRMSLPVATINDGSAATLGELHFGAGRGLRRFCVITLGTGVGGGIVIDGNLVTGEGGVPPELGAMVLHDADPGNRTLEEFASAGGFTTAYARAGGASDATPLQICRLLADGDPIARQVVDRICRRIAQALGALINALNLEACILSGGIAQAGQMLTSRIADQLSDFTWPFLRSRCQVLPGQTGAISGIIGAAEWSRGFGEELPTAPGAHSR